MTDAPELEVALEKQGLAHDRKLIAEGDFVLVGPVEGKGKKARDPAGVAGWRDIAVVLSRLDELESRFIAPVNGSGAHVSTQPLWRAAKVSPAAPWYVEAKTDALEQAIAEGAYTLVERGLWLARGRKPLALLVDGDPRMTCEVHVMRSFRVNHPAAKLFGTWVTGPQGRRVAGSARGWRAPQR